jgi:hypothetical protein
MEASTYQCVKSDLPVMALHQAVADCQPHRGRHHCCQEEEDVGFVNTQRATKKPTVRWKAVRGFIVDQCMQ